MKTEMNIKELEQVNGGNFLDEITDAFNKVKKLIPNPFEPKPIIDPVIAHTK